MEDVDNVGQCWRRKNICKNTTEVAKEVSKEYLKTKVIEKSEGKTNVLATNEISIQSLD
jgi:hypothetical protein